MIFDLGDNVGHLRIAKVLRLNSPEGYESMSLLPICMGCERQVEEGQYYYVSITGGLVYHPNCERLARNNQLTYLSRLG